MDSDQLVTVQHLVKRYGDFAAVNDISFSIRDREIFGIIGPNGAGKTTTVECISGLRVPDSGSIRVYGLSPQKKQGQNTRVRRCATAGERDASAPQGGRSGKSLRLFLPERIDYE